MRVLSVNMGADTGGGGINIAKAFKTFSEEVKFNSICKGSNYIQYPKDLPWSQVTDRWKTADLVHLHNSLNALTTFGPKPYILHHHGTKYRENYESLNRSVENGNGKAVVSTIDLLDYGDNLTWVPLAQSLPELSKYRTANPSSKLRVGHSPTNRSVKNTEEFIQACKKVGVEPIIIEKQSWSQCLATKGTLDIFYDQVGLGYGNSAIEAWAMGIPVICGASPSTLDRMRAEFGRLPFYEATSTVDSIAEAILALSDFQVRTQYRKIAIEHVARWHDGRETVKRLSEVYRQVLDMNK